MNKKSPDLFKVNQYANILKGSITDPLTMLGFTTLAGDAMVNGVPTIEKINQWIGAQLRKHPGPKYVNKPTTAKQIQKNIGNFLDYIANTKYD